jgi:hypothetical protein
MARYRKKPVVIDAFVWLPGCDMPDWARRKMVEHELHANIVTLEGTMKVAPGDYIIQGVEFEVYPCKPSIFEKTYDRVED